MTLVGFRARNHRQQTIGGLRPNHAGDDRATTPETFNPLNELFRFTVDVAASEHNTKVPEHWFGIHDDGLSQPWGGERVWCNPPYSNLTPWLEKAWMEFEDDPVGDEFAELIVMLVPANRTEQKWWQEYVEPYRDQPNSPLRVKFLPGRIRFIAAGKTEVGPNERPPFGCCLLIWERNSNQSEVERAA